MKSKKFWKNPFFRIGVSLSALGILFFFFPLNAFTDGVAGVPVPGFLIIVSGFLFLHGFGAVKWKLILQIPTSQIPLTTFFRSYYAGLFGNLFLPSAVGGDFVRAVPIYKRTGNKKNVVLGGILDRLIDTLSLGIWMGAGSLILADNRGEAMLPILILLGMVTFLSLMAISFFIPLPDRVPKKLRIKVEAIKFWLIELFRHPGPGLIAIVISLCVQGGFIFFNQMIGKWCGIDVSFSIWMFAWPFAKFAAMIPISIGGIGVREVALVSVLAKFGVEAANATAAGLVWQAVVYLSGLLSGIFYFTLREKNSSFKE